MTTSQTITEISAALVAVHSELDGGVTFDATNPFLKNKYATLGALIDASRETLAKHGLAIEQMPTSYEGGVAVRTTIRHKSGEFISDTVAIPMQDEKGKSMAQVAGSIITYLRRYAYASVLGLYGEEDTDGNAPPGRSSTPKQEPQQRKAATTPQVANPSGKDATEGQKGRFIAMLDPVKDAAIELFRKWKWIGPDQELAFVPLSKVPKTKREFDGIMEDIQAFMDGGSGNEEFWDVVIPVPLKGMKRPDYMKNPDTIRSLYEAGKDGDDDARKRLFGFANNWQPTGWKKRDGTEMPPSDEDNAARAALDQFLEWEKEKGKE